MILRVYLQSRGNMGYTKKVLDSVKLWKEELNSPLQFKCIVCGDKFLTQKELSEHQYLFCTGGW
jgi:hypothetical protein